MIRSPVRRALFAVVFASAMPLFVLGCPKKQPAVEDAGPPPPAPSPSVLQLAPLEDDAGDAGDGDADAGHKWTGPGMNPNEAKVRACCARLQTQINMLPNQQSPEVQSLKNFVAQCNGIAAQVHTNPNAPEFQQLKNIPGCM